MCYFKIKLENDVLSYSKYDIKVLISFKLDFCVNIMFVLHIFVLHRKPFVLHRKAFVLHRTYVL